MKPCCGIAPVVIKGDGKSYCSECDVERRSQYDGIDFSKIYEEMDDWAMTSSPYSKKKCECGSDKLGSDKHSSWCPKYRDE